MTVIIRYAVETWLREQLLLMTTEAANYSCPSFCPSHDVLSPQSAAVDLPGLELSHIIRRVGVVYIL